jgi:hypothetical protein
LALCQELRTMPVNKNRLLLERENPINANVFIERWYFSFLE